MSNLAVTISGFVVGDNLEIRRTVTGLGAAMVKAWLTIKRDPQVADTDAKIQKVITTDDEAGVGQIETAGASEVDGEIRFDLTQADTTALSTILYVHDIQIKQSDGKVFTLEKGTIQLTADVTRSTT